MNKKYFDLINIMLIVLLSICSLSGILSMNFSKSFDIVDQYGEVLTIFGSGIYSGDTYFKAAISIGTDFSILFVVVPLLVWAYKKTAKQNSDINRLELLSLYAVALYYSINLAFGIKFNQFHLAYIALFGCTLFGMFFIFRKTDIKGFTYPLTKGLKVFLIACGIALIVAWFPDIIPAILNGRPPSLISTYTTEITYVLDIGILAPLCFVSLHLLTRKDALGVVILAVILKLFIIVGIMMISQTLCQYFSGVDIPLPVLITKSVSFMILGGVALFFNQKLYKSNKMIPVQE